LQLLANDEDYRNKIIDGLVQDAIDEEERKKEELENNQFNPFDNGSSASTSQTGPGGWYFYNNTTLGFGFTDFTKNWGNRKLEDNWRRSNRETIASFDDELDGELDSLSNDSNKVNEKTTPEYYLKFIPLTPEKMNVSHNKIIEALYALGNIYREDFQDYKNSITSFEDLITKYDTCRYKLPSWYNLYRISLLIDDDVMKRKYESLILNNYPESEYARIIQDPSYNKVTRENRKRVDNYYSIIYNMYSDKRYKKVLIRCDKAKSIFADNHLQDHFDLLAALSIGHTSPIDTFIVALKDVITKHPDSEVSPEAQRILDLIKKGIKVNTESVITDISYTHIFSSKFHFIAIIPSADKKTSKYKVDVANFNSEFFGNHPFKVSNMFIDLNNQLIIVKSMKDYDAAVDYYKTFILNKGTLNELNSKKYQYLLISPENFILFYKNKDIKGYQKFFDENFEIEL